MADPPAEPRARARTAGSPRQARTSCRTGSDLLQRSATFAANASAVSHGVFQYSEITSSIAPVTRRRRQHLLAGTCWVLSASHLHRLLRADVERARRRRRGGPGSSPSSARTRSAFRDRACTFASATCAFSAAGSFGLGEGEHVAAHHVAAVPLFDRIVQPYSLPAVWPAATNSPLAQSPMIWHAGLALDHQAGRIVPVAAGSARVDIGRATCR